MKKTLIVITGTTASGKTALSIDLAKKIGGEIISCDSRQFYKELNIGTAKPSKEEMSGIKHHFINNKNILDEYSAGGFEDEAIECIARLHKNNIQPIMVGGSGLYEKAVLQGLDDFPAISDKSKEEVGKLFQKEGLLGLQDALKEKDPTYFDQVDKKNHTRLIRALEVCIETKRAYSSFTHAKIKNRPFSVLKLAIDWEREKLYERINLRVDMMIGNGLLQEAEALHHHKKLKSLQTVGYKEIFAYIEGKLNLEECIEEIKKNSRRYAKKQLTWHKKDETIHWFYPNEVEKITALLKAKHIKFLDE